MDRVATISPSPIPNQPVKRIRKKRRVSPMVYATRLLILGIGIGVISGTILSILNLSLLELVVTIEPEY